MYKKIFFILVIFLTHSLQLDAVQAQLITLNTKLEALKGGVINLKDSLSKTSEQLKKLSNRLTNLKLALTQEKEKHTSLTKETFIKEPTFENVETLMTLSSNDLINLCRKQDYKEYYEVAKTDYIEKEDCKVGKKYYKVGKIFKEFLEPDEKEEVYVSQSGRRHSKYLKPYITQKKYIFKSKKGITQEEEQKKVHELIASIKSDVQKIINTKWPESLPLPKQTTTRILQEYITTIILDINLENIRPLEDMSDAGCFCQEASLTSKIFLILSILYNAQKSIKKDTPLVLTSLAPGDLLLEKIITGELKQQGYKIQTFNFIDTDYDYNKKLNLPNCIGLASRFKKALGEEKLLHKFIIKTGQKAETNKINFYSDAQFYLNSCKETKELKADILIIVDPGDPFETHKSVYETFFSLTKNTLKTSGSAFCICKNKVLKIDDKITMEELEELTHYTSEIQLDELLKKHKIASESTL